MTLRRLSTILSIETATAVCSVALSRDGNLISLRESSEKNAHSSVLTKFVEEVIADAGISFSGIDAIAVSEGPGSYTGLRIGVAAAKGLCYALDRPLIAVPTLKAMAEGIRRSPFAIRHPLFTSPGEQRTAKGEKQKMMLCPLIDARRMEVFSAIYDESLNEVRETRAEIIDGSSFAELLKDHLVFFAGDGATKCKSILSHSKNALFPEDFSVSARHMILLAEEKFRTGLFENLAYFEPRYLKDFVAGIPKVKGLQ